MLDPIIELITANTLSLVITIILGIMIIIFLIKRLWRLVIISVFILLIYVGYLFFTGQKVPTNVDEILEHGSEQLKKYQIEDKLKKMKDGVKDSIKEGMKERIKEDLKKKKEKELEKELKEKGLGKV